MYLGLHKTDLKIQQKIKLFYAGRSLLHKTILNTISMVVYRNDVKKLKTKFHFKELIVKDLFQIKTFRIIHQESYTRKNIRKNSTNIKLFFR